MQIYHITVGDTLTPIAAELVQQDEDGEFAPLDLTGYTVKFLMVSADDTIKIDHQAAVIVSAAAGHVQYNWADADVDEEGVFFGWFIIYNAGATRHDTFPARGRKLRIVMSASA